MSETNTEARGQVLEALRADFMGDDTPTPVVEEKKPEVEEKDPNEITNTEEVKEETKTEEVKPEEKKEEVKDEKEEKKEETKTEEVKDEKKELEFKIEDIEGYKKPAEDGTWKAAGELFKVEVADETPEAFVAAVEAKYKADIEAAKNLGEETLFAKFKPETVAALKLIEMGMPEAQAVDPLRGHNQLYDLNDEALVRWSLEKNKDWDEDRINLEMESLTANPAKLDHEAKKLREDIVKDAQRITAEREALINKYTENREKAVIAQREQSLNQIKEALNNGEPFMGAKISPEVNAEIFNKYSRGDYGDIFKDGKAIADYLRFKALGHKILSEVKTSSYNKGKEEYTKKELLRIPDKSGEVAKKVVEKITNNQTVIPEGVMKDFG